MVICRAAVPDKEREASAELADDFGMDEQMSPLAGRQNIEFTNRQLVSLILPMLAEQLLGITVGLADSLMVATVGDASISAVSLVDSVSALMIYIFSAMATGGAVVAGQYLGRREREEACRSAQQLMVLLGVVSLAVTALLYLFRDLIVTRLFGHIDADVMEATNIYYSYVMASIPGIALYNGGAFSPEQLARFGQQAENRHFGKPSGLMDQLACALDGAVYIDFAAGEIAPVAAPFADMGLTLSLTDTGGSHAGLTAAYAALPADMCRVARRFGAETLSQVDPADFYAHRQPGPADDRAAHFFEENARVPLMRDALVHRDAETYLRLMNASGRSSEQLLRNIRAPGGDDRLERGLARAAALLDGVGAWRVHGGGFAGCVQALMPRDAFHAYRKGMEALFGPNSCRELHITRAK